MLPDYNFLSAPPWLINLLHWITLTLHFAAMNFVLGGVIIMLFGKLENKWQHPVVQRFLKLFPTVMAATVTFGVAPLLFVQLTYHRQVYSASIISGWFWLMIIPVVIVVYYLLYATAFRKPDRAGDGPSTLLWIGLAGMLYVALVYSSVFSLAESPDAMKALYATDQSGLALNPEVGSYILRWLHMILGAVTVGGFWVGWIGSDNERAYAVGRTFLLYGMIGASLLGIAYLLMLDSALKP
ncbi:MAG: hypothetical protein KKA42_13615, partial [candidate division Zixibacteria bacterium]|nr:hypothetical protein [candidate division Zixibacteria bacterium]